MHKDNDKSAANGCRPARGAARSRRPPDDGSDSICRNLRPACKFFADNTADIAALRADSDFRNKCLLRIRIKSGSIEAHAPMISVFPREAEIILPRRSSFFVKKVRKEIVKTEDERGNISTNEAIVIYCDLLQRDGEG